MTIGFIGNFSISYTTENDRKWSFEKLGHKVITFQEDKTKAEDIINSLDNIDVLFYSHTHGWDIPKLKEVFAECKSRRIPTASVHLDLWRGLKRWHDVGNESTWHTEYVFTPDGTGEWPEGVNHQYMRPGVKESSCYIAQPDPVKYPHEIIFVGSDGYHPEYQQRPQLINFLKQTYGSKFGLYGGSGYPTIREHELNVLYATAKIAVGDSCFSQSDTPIKKYYSDRIPETMARSAFLIHPRNKFLEHLPIEFYNNLDDLREKIDYWTQKENETERKKRASIAHEYAKKHDTYTKIGEEILKIVFNKLKNAKV